MNISINIKSLINLSVVFILFTVIGTVSHEYGHITVAKYLGYETTLHYGSMNYYPKGYFEDEDLEELNLLAKDYPNIEYDSWPDEVKEKANELRDSLEKRYWNEKSNNGLYVILGGPIQTMLTGTIGLLFLLWRKEFISKNGMKLLDWLAVFLSLFWLREVFNLVTSIGGDLISPDGTWFAGDELYISQGLNVWNGTIPIVLAIIGLTISFYVIFRIMPHKIRLTFILSGFIGGIAGFIIWMNIIGPKILP